MPEGLTLGQIGEQDLIKRLAAYALSLIHI